MAAVAAQGGDHLDSMTTITGDHGKPLIDLGIVGQTTESQFATTARATEAGGRAAVGAVLSLGHTTEIASETMTGTEIEIVTENGGQIETGTVNEMTVTEIVTGVETAAGTEVETVVEIVVGLGRTTTGTVDDTATILGHHHHVYPTGIEIVIGNEMETVEGIGQEIETGTGIEAGKGTVLEIGTGPEIGTGQETGKDTETGTGSVIGSGTVKETATKTAIETEIRIGIQT